MGMRKLKGLDPEYMHDCCGVGNKELQRCRFLRYVHFNGELWLICAKGTAVGIKHSQRVDNLLKEYPDGKHGDMTIVAGDNCEGKAGEFAHMFKEKQN
ncbi:MAG: hypothetical protein COU51_01010 [Parcubacteria group bacterium CG10_big_fil_rev_8_21_14_0_10_36_14]|nr:MAG: hypothetical protein COU51_01010 [Parcubacteria group bacterium CG10_big_fil_rev_8_21_14_0_10_36_14]